MLWVFSSRSLMPGSVTDRLNYVAGIILMIVFPDIVLSLSRVLR